MSYLERVYIKTLDATLARVNGLGSFLFMVYLWTYYPVAVALLIIDVDLVGLWLFSSILTMFIPLLWPVFMISEYNAKLRERVTNADT